LARFVIAIVLIAAAALPAAAQNATWLSSPSSGTFNTAANWSPATVPTGTAFFDASGTTALSFSTATTLGGFTLNAGAPAYTFTTGQTLTFNGAGIVINGGSAAITNSGNVIFVGTGTAGTASIANSGNLQFSVNSTAGNAAITNTGGGTVAFLGTSTAGSATITSISSSIVFFNASTAGSATLNSFGPMDFNGTSTAGNATITNSSALNFNNGSTAENATINNSAQLHFNDTSTAGNATITNITTLSFDNSSTAGAAKITNNLNMDFNNASTAGNATVSNTGNLNFHGTGSAGSAAITNSSNLNFRDSSSGGSATINNTTAGTVAFFNTSTAGSATINSLGTLNFNDTSTAGAATITSSSALNFNNASTAGSANIKNFGRALFGNTSSAGNATIANSSILSFRNTGTAGSAVISNDSGLNFYDTSTAGIAVITNNVSLGFNDASTAGSATVTTSAGGGTQFHGSSTGGDARFITGGTFDMSGLAAAGMTAGSIEGPGSYNLGAKALTVGNNNLSTEVSGIISGTGGALTKVGTGTLVLSGANGYTGATTVNAGTLLVNGSIAASSGVTVNSGAILGGTGILPTTVVNGGATLSPGASIGTVAVTGNLTVKPGSTYLVDVSPLAADRTNVSGTATLAGTVDAVFQPGSYNNGTRYTIVSAGTRAGTFDTLVTSNVPAFLTVGLAYTPTEALLVTTSNIGSIPGLTPNERAVAGALDTAFNAGHGLFPGFGNLTSGNVPAALDALSGEIHASIKSAMMDDSGLLRAAVLGRLRQTAVSPVDAPDPAIPDLTVWMQAFVPWGGIDSDGNAAEVGRSLGGFIVGVDRRFQDDWRIGLAGGYSSSRVSVDARASSAAIDSAHLAAYLGHAFGAFNLRAAAAGSWHDISVNRTAAFPGFHDELHSSYDGNTVNVFGEFGYGMSFQHISVEPYAGLAFVRIEAGGFSELGGADALTSGSSDQQVGYTSLGIRTATTMAVGSGTVAPHLTVAWQHALSDVTPQTTLAFLATGADFTVHGVPLARDSALIDAGIDAAVGSNISFGLAYIGQLSGRAQDQAIMGRVVMRF